MELTEIRNKVLNDIIPYMSIVDKHYINKLLKQLAPYNKVYMVTPRFKDRVESVIATIARDEQLEDVDVATRLTYTVGFIDNYLDVKYSDVVGKIFTVLEKHAELVLPELIFDKKFKDELLTTPWLSLPLFLEAMGPDEIIKLTEIKK